ncbi:hypothetical protein [Acidovorax sp. A1169]|uniref:hypothetical protein n=1 Tax=Acidovorax sp. A1169 TaxID=3059524 RepID=UPI002737DAC6|nr:hypothetical protein [Acidovorax sp. A1169]MDP4078839.1 hypothetical protein [Acidovorax sp. A1169]
MQACEYGLVCATDDEALLVKNVNAFLAAQGWRPLYRKQPTGLRNPERPDLEPQYSHYYCQFHKQSPRWYFDLYPNADKRGVLRFPEHPQAGWTLFFNHPGHETDTPEELAQLDALCGHIAAGTGFAAVLLHTYQAGEDRH